MTHRIPKRWLAIFAAIGILAALGGWIAMGVRHVRVAARRTSDL